MNVRLLVARGTGAPQSIVVDAGSPEAAAAHAAADGWFVLEVGRASNNAERASAHARLTPARTVLLLEQLSDLLIAGLSLVSALETLSSSVEGREQQLVRSLISELRTGQSFSQALESSAAFSDLLVSLIRASEQTADIRGAIDRYIDHERRMSALREKLVSASLYPLLLSSVGAAVLAFLLLHVIPKFARVFESMTADLPGSAKLMIWWAKFLREGGSLVVATMMAAAALLLMLLLTPQARARSIDLLVSVPWVLARLRTLYLSRWYRTIGTLVQAGVPFAKAVDQSTHVLPKSMHQAAGGILHELRSGLRPSEAFERAGLNTQLSAQLLRSSDQSGALGEALCRIANFHDSEATRGLDKLMKVLEPSIMVVLGLVIGFLVVLMYIPIFELASAIQ